METYTIISVITVGVEFKIQTKHHPMAHVDAIESQIDARIAAGKFETIDRQVMCVQGDLLDD